MMCVKTNYLNGQSIQQMKDWIKENPGYFSGVLERERAIKEMEENPYAHYYGFCKPID